MDIINFIYIVSLSVLTILHNLLLNYISTILFSFHW